MSPVLSIAVASLALTASGVLAQTPARTAAAADFSLPRAYAGYAQPEITQCATTGALRSECVVPAMTAGRYVILARAGATSTGADATQTLTISIGGEACAALKSAAFTGKKGLPPLVCQVTFLTDSPLTIAAAFGVENATPDPAGPRLVVRRVRWNGVVESRGGALPPRQAPAKK